MPPRVGAPREGRPAGNNVQFERSNKDGVPRCQTTRKFRGRTSNGLASIRSSRKKRVALASRHPSCRYPGRCRPTRISCGRNIDILAGAPLRIEDRDTIRLATLQVNVPVRSAQMADPELTSVLALFRRAANVIARLEDAVVFRGLELQAPPRRRLALNRRDGFPRVSGKSTADKQRQGSGHQDPPRLALDDTTIPKLQIAWQWVQIEVPATSTTPIARRSAGDRGFQRHWPAGGPRPLRPIREPCLASNCS